MPNGKHKTTNVLGETFRNQNFLPRPLLKWSNETEVLHLQPLTLIIMTETLNGAFLDYFIFGHGAKLT